ncbi:iron-sulfur cluster insertion protein ErpA [Candidatus Purcelliella pentastirinorum]|uniref:Iron-sulfur cluster insertion protein ErpA n=1 Tax=Candidatus Purcelliella pentastirinorum TaxID=472834 RepID=A0AAX3NAT1_9ENTR|nr:iron-sulfur cluster insertion protein ErpA [Candidatus Purcelliella pentastirinorum]WDI78636.1 iron-sulfur cluster insertion protein ErpA [Candidatus Purcelliella pentastirinorum]WDR80336.1 iron-sulfur cluster insertion protein ErpA [Candidatus Purcelliella pentastirinorum]
MKSVNLIFTEAAAKKLKKIIDIKNNINMKLRVYIIGGGCNGLKYKFILDDKVNDNDFIFEKLGVFLIVDEFTFQYIIGGSVDYIENIIESKFSVLNPNAKVTCNCGLSFNI